MSPTHYGKNGESCPRTAGKYGESIMSGGGIVAQALNSEQQEAVNAREGAICLLSGPGSGKTTVIVARFEAIAKTTPVEEILCLTFTRAAANEMAKRAGLGAAQKVFRTFHSFCLALVLAEAAHLDFKLNPNPIPTPQQRNRLIAKLCRQHGMQFKDLVGFISRNKRRGISPDDSADIGVFNYAKAYGDYEATCRAEGWLDFDSMLVEALKLLERPEIRARWQFKFIQIDEAQDTDDLQWRLVQLLSEKYGNVMFVGDPNQAIYAWRDARPENMTNFLAWFPEGRYLYLGQNYRSTQIITKFVRENAPIVSGLTERMVTDNEEGEAIKFQKLDNEEAEAVVAVSAAAVEPNDSAILARTNRLLAPLENFCLESGFKYRLLGRSGFWHQDEVQNLAAFAEFVAFRTDRSVKRIIRAPYSPSRYLKKREVVQWLEEEQTWRTEDASFMSILRTWAPDDQQREAATRLHGFLNALHAETHALPAQEAMKRIIERTDVEAYYENEDATEEDNYALENITALTQIAGKHATLADFARHAQKAFHASANRKGITISTVHQSKGKEWKNVFLIAVDEGRLPHKLGDFEEERRIFFVAASRAAKKLSLSFTGTPSRFLKSYLTPEIQAQLNAGQAQVDIIRKSFGESNGASVR